MLPPPPDLSGVSAEWKDRELFWVVKHGIKYTGMPSWVSLQRDDEVWTVVSFLRRLRGLDPAAYRDLALGGLQVPPQSGRELATEEGAAEAVSACARCHGAEDRGPSSSLVPILHGQPATFLAGALQAYADGRRPSGIMQPIASDLRPDATQRLADYYARLPPPRPPSGAADPAAIENGRRLAMQGHPAVQIPPCMACHGAEALTAYPRLSGQNAGYLRGQLRLWKSGVSRATDADAIMAPIARRLTDRQIEEVAAYFASVAAGTTGGASPAGEAPRP
jgi:cytochrome c553